MFLFQNVQSLAYTLWTFSRQYRVLYTYLHLTPNKKTGHHHSSFPRTPSRSHTTPTLLHNLYSPLNILHKLLQLLIAIPPPSPTPINHNLLLLLLILLRHRAQNILQLVFRNLLSYLARPRQHNQTVLDISRAALFDESNAPETIRSVGRQDLREDVLSLIRCAEEKKRTS